MRYALNISEDNRILSATYEEFAWEGAVIVDALPEGNVCDYLYVDGEYVHDPLPAIEAIEEPTADEVLNAMLGVV